MRVKEIRVAHWKNQTFESTLVRRIANVIAESYEYVVLATNGILQRHLEATHGARRGRCYPLLTGLAPNVAD